MRSGEPRRATGGSAGFAASKGSPSPGAWSCCQLREWRGASFRAAWYTWHDGGARQTKLRTALVALRSSNVRRALNQLIAVAAQMAGNLRDVGLGHALEKLAFDSGPRKADPELRLIAVEALGAMNTLAAQPDIAMTFVDSPATRVRAQAAAALRWGSVQGQEAALWQLLADEDPFVAPAAAKALLNRGSSGAAALDETAPSP